MIKTSDEFYENVYEFEHPAHEYALEVRSGEVTACRWVKLAIERYFSDIDSMEEKGLYFDREAVDKVIDFYKETHHFKGEWSGEPIKLEPWQAFIVWNVFGFRWADTGYRRFKIVYQTVARKNGKTTMIAPVGLHLLSCDGEEGAEVYSVAHDRRQAREVFDAARVMALRGILKEEVNVLQHSIVHPISFSKFEPLTADEDSHHGKNIHCALCDEMHVWPKRGLWSVLRTGMGARRQPLMWAITTAGTDQTSICYELHEYTQKILKGTVVDDSFFGIIYSLDTKADWQDLKTAEEYKKDPKGIQEDDFTDEATWIKANPNLGVSVKIQDIRDELRSALAIVANQNSFLRLRLNLWTQVFSEMDRARFVGRQLHKKNLRRIVL